MKTLARSFFLVLLAAGLLAACAEWPALVRRHTYPPNFRYIERGQLQSAMWQLARDVDELDRVMRAPAMTAEARRAEVLRLLTAMQAATEDLETEGRPSNHPLISNHLGTFRRDLAQARAGVDADPPNYYLVGSVSGACLVCHAPSSRAPSSGGEAPLAALPAPR